MNSFATQQEMVAVAPSRDLSHAKYMTLHVGVHSSSQRKSTSRTASPQRTASTLSRNIRRRYAFNTAQQSDEVALLNADWVMPFVCSTRVDDIGRAAALNQAVPARINDASTPWNAYPPFLRLSALIDLAVCRSLAPFVHRNALISGKAAMECRVIPLKTTGKRKPNETLPRCGIRIR
jgi:hypothetical protein